ncbi:MAG: F0F1 ATP synthase subunit A [Candidatus Peregrinibacteria bacterium]
MEVDISIAAEHLFHIGSFFITNSFLVGVMVSAMLVGLFLLVVKKKTIVPSRSQSLVEVMIEGALHTIEDVMQDKNQARRAFPLIFTIFVFVLLSNWIGLLPGVGTIGLIHDAEGHKTLIPFLRSTSADLNFTLGLSLSVMIVVQFVGIVSLGLWGYGKKFLVSPFQKPYIIGTFVGLLEIVSEVAKIVSFTFRLFGNVFAGEVLLTTMLHLIPYFLPLPFLALEVLAGLIQATVFAMLATVFMKMAMTEAQH